MSERHPFRVRNRRFGWGTREQAIKSLSQNGLGEGDSPIFPRDVLLSGRGKIGTVPDRSGIGTKWQAKWRVSGRNALAGGGPSSVEWQHEQRAV